MVDAFDDFGDVDGFRCFGGGSVFAVEVPEIDVLGQFFVSLAFEVFAYVVFDGVDLTGVLNLWVVERECLFHGIRGAFNDDWLIEGERN